MLWHFHCPHRLLENVLKFMFCHLLRTIPSAYHTTVKDRYLVFTSLEGAGVAYMMSIESRHVLGQLTLSPNGFNKSPFHRLTLLSFATTAKVVIR